MKVRAIAVTVYNYLTGALSRSSAPVQTPPPLVTKYGKAYEGYYKETKYDSDFRHLIADAYKPDNRWSNADFGWQQDVKQNLSTRLDSLPQDELLRVAKMALSVSQTYPREKFQRVLTTGLPQDSKELLELKEAIAERQFKGLQDIANHALTAEQAAVAPLSSAITTYRRYPQIQEAATLFIADEARHSSVFERYLTQKLGGTKRMPLNTYRQFELFSYMAPRMSGAAVFLALAVETIGGAFFEFFAEKAPDPLFREVCSTIANRDEKRHMKICQTLYKVVHNPEKQSWFGKWYEKQRNDMGMKVIAKDLYTQNIDPDFYLMQAVQSFGVEPKELLQYIYKRVEEEFAGIGYKIDPAILPVV